MAKVMKICKACGKEYEACHTPNPGVFRWRDVACSPECAEKYIHDVMVARGEIVEEPTEVAKNDGDFCEIMDVNEQAETMEPNQSDADEPAVRNYRFKKHK